MFNPWITLISKRTLANTFGVNTRSIAAANQAQKGLGAEALLLRGSTIKKFKCPLAGGAA